MVLHGSKDYGGDMARELLPSFEWVRLHGRLFQKKMPLLMPRGSLHHPDGTQDLLGAGDEFLEAEFFRKAAEGQSHELGNIDDR